MLDETIDKEALRNAIYHNTGWNFMCPTENIEEINRYCETGDFDSMSQETHYQLNGIYRYIAQDYECFSGGKHLPNIFLAEKKKAEMSYSSFAKIFYREALIQLKVFHSYYGRFVDGIKCLNIDKSFMHPDKHNSMFLPRYVLNDDASAKLCIEFMNYYVTLMPQLGVVFANEAKLVELYNNALEMDVLNNKKAMAYIDLLISTGANALEQAGILEK